MSTLKNNLDIRFDIKSDLDDGDPYVDPTEVNNLEILITLGVFNFFKEHLK